MNKYEKLIEYIISEQNDLARELFHEIVAEKSRGIYESLLETDPMDEMGGSKVEDLVNEIEVDHTGQYEADDNMMPDSMGDEEDMGDMGDEEDMGDMGDEEDMGDMSDMDSEEDMGDMSDMDSEEDMGDEELENRVDDLESALDELKAEFDKIMAGEEEGEEDDEEEMEENLVREYVEKVSAPSNTSEGHEVGAGGSAAIHKTSPGLQKGNRMGGTAGNIVAGGAESAPDGQSPKSANNYGTKGRGNLPHAGQFENVPGAKTKGYSNKAGAKKGEESGVNKHSVESGGN